MIITCWACSTKFNLDEKMLKPTGTKVRCSVCAQVFTAYPPGEPVEAAKTEPSESVPQHTDSQQPVATESGVTEAAATKSPEADSDDDFSLEDDSDIDDAVSDYLDDVESDDKADSGTDVDESDAIDDEDATIIADLDDEDLDFSLDMESDEDLDLDSDDDLNLDLDLDSDEGLDLLPDLESDGDETIIANLDEEDLDLDLSSLDHMFEDDQANNSTVIVDVDDDDLTRGSLDESEASQEVEADASNYSEEFSLDSEIDDLEEEAGSESITDEDSDIDLSEIEEMLEKPETDGSGSSIVPDQDKDLELDIESSLDNEKWMHDTAKEGTLVEDEVFDLSELEQVLDDIDLDEKEDEPVEEQELALDYALPPDQDAETDSADSDNDLDLELDLLDLENDQQPDRQSTDDTDDDNMGLEFEIEDKPQPKETLNKEQLEETDAISEPLASKKVEAPAETVAEEPVFIPPVKKKSKKLFVFILILIILGGTGYGAYFWIEKNNIDISFLSNYLNMETLSNYLHTKKLDPGNAKLTTEDISAKFIDNTNVGKLFVITGKVRNGYEHSRGIITLTGNIYSSDKVLIAQEKVYCGNVMSDFALMNLKMGPIKERLANRLGDDRNNIKIEPGQTIPFMVVFSGLPDDIEEYTIEVTGSKVLK